MDIANYRARMGARIRQAREQRGVTLAELALCTSLTADELAQVERGERSIGAMALLDIARACNVEYMALLAD